jgi:drug/metabolite transporter (DMT)-like permease
VGTAYHFRKLHGEPRLVLRARHESLGRFLTAAVWAGLCLALAAAVIYGLRRPSAAARAYRYWPSLAAILGTVWLFLLPAGVVGLALLVAALCVLIARSRKRQTTGPETSNVGQGLSAS